MASEDVKIEYTRLEYTPGMTYGSVAYDFNAIPAYDEEEELYEEPQRQQRTASRAVAKNTQGISLVAILGFAAVAVLAVFILLAHLELTVVTSETAELESQLIELQETQKNLQIRYESTIDLNEIDEYATNVLGMVTASEVQIDIDSGVGADRAEILTDNSENTSVWVELYEFIVSLLAYLK